MLSFIRLVNFKCFEELELRCAPLTLLCGLNGMGKSSVIQALLLLNASRNSDRLELNHASVDLGAPRDVLFEDAETDSISFELRWPGQRPFHATYTLSKDESAFVDRDVVENNSHYVKWGPFESPAENLANHRSSEAANLALSLRSKLRRVPVSHPPVYVGAERVGPRKIYVHSDTFHNPASLDAAGEHTLSYLSAHRRDRLGKSDARCAAIRGRSLFDALEYWLQEVTPGVHLDYEVVRDADALIAGYSFDRPGDVRTRRYRATNVGFGLSYVLPVLAGLLVPSAHLCLIENPEAHLHPRGQARMAELAVRAAVAGVQVIAETHSDHFLDGVRIAVREGLIEPEDTAVHYFERENGKSVVVTPEIDANGRLSHWPAGFFDQHDHNLARLLTPKP